MCTVQFGSVQDYQVPTDDRVRDEEDRRQQHVGFHCWQTSQQATDQDGRQQIV